jgi:hypothetical protein
MRVEPKFSFGASLNAAPNERSNAIISPCGVTWFEETPSFLQPRQHRRPAKTSKPRHQKTNAKRIRKTPTKAEAGAIKGTYQKRPSNRSKKKSICSNRRRRSRTRKKATPAIISPIPHAANKSDPDTRNFLAQSASETNHDTSQQRALFRVAVRYKVRIRECS